MTHCYDTSGMNARCCYLSSDCQGILTRWRSSCQAGWVDSDLTFSHYRDKEKVEVDLVIEQGRKVWAVEVKRAASVHNKDGAGLAKIAAQAGKNFQGGMLLYSGANCLPLKVDKCFVVPMDRLWA